MPVLLRQRGTLAIDFERLLGLLLGHEQIAAGMQEGRCQLRLAEVTGQRESVAHEPFGLRHVPRGHGQVAEFPQDAGPLRRLAGLLGHPQRGAEALHRPVISARAPHRHEPGG